MKRTCVLLVTSLILFGLLPAGAFACDHHGASSTAVCAQQRIVMIRIDVKDLPHLAASLTARSVKQAARLSSQLPRELNKQMQTGTDNAQVAFRAATGQTQSTFHRISAEVALLSLQLLRGAFSYFSAALSGLLR
jgi:hypothetical protein